jgi:Flp pilus assembly protein CpaB
MNEANPLGRPPQAGSSPTLIIVAVVLGLVTVVLTNFYINMVRKDVEGRSMHVYRLNKTLEPGDRLNVHKDLITLSVSDKFRESMDAMSVIITKPGDLPLVHHDETVTRRVNQGEFLSPSFFTGTGKTIDYQVTQGKRGTPLEINSRNAPGLLRPGMYIDISANLTQPGRKVPQSMRIMERLKVLAVGAVTDETAGSRRINFNTITVETEPAEDLALLTIAKFVGKDGFDISIRNPTDMDAKIGVNTEVLKLLGLDK